MPTSPFFVKDHKIFAKGLRASVSSCTRLQPQDFVKSKLPTLGTGKNIKICIVSNGVPDHPLFDQNIMDKTNVGPSEHIADFTGHSHVMAGLLAANDLNSLMGLAPDALLAFVKAGDDQGATTGESIAAGILWGVLVGAHVVVVPMVITYLCPLVEIAVEKAIASNVLVVMEGTVDGCVLPSGVISTLGTICPASLVIVPYKDDGYASVSFGDFTPAIVGGITALLIERVKQADKKVRAAVMTKHILSFLNG